MYKYITLPSKYDYVKNVKKNAILYFSFDQREKLKKKTPIRNTSRFSHVCWKCICLSLT